MTGSEQPIRIGEIITTPDGERRLVVGYTAPPDNPARALVTERIPGVDEDYQPVIPRGWTYLKHGTNLVKWGDENPFIADRITIHRSMSTVTKEDAEQSQREGLSSTAETYSRKVKPPEMSDEEFEKRNKSFEIRVYFYLNHARTLADPEYRKAVPQETMKEIARYYYDNIQFGRHPLIPHGTTLIKLAHSKENGKDVFYFVPEHQLASYILEARNVRGSGTSAQG